MINFIDEKVIDVTKKLEIGLNSDESILSVGGGKPDSYSSTPHSDDKLKDEELQTPKRDLSNKFFEAEHESSDLLGDSMLSPILLSNGDKETLNQFSQRQSVIDDNSIVTNTLQLQVSNNSGNSSTASEILIRSTRRAFSKKMTKQTMVSRAESGSSDERFSAQKMCSAEGRKAVLIKSSSSLSTTSSSSSSSITKSSHDETKTAPIKTSSSLSNNQSYQSVRVSKKKLKEVKKPENPSLIKLKTNR